MTLQEFYKAVDGDYSEAIDRFEMEKLIDRFVLKFPSDPTMDNLRKAINAGNIEESFKAAHTLKGVSANLSYTALSKAAAVLTEQLRPRTAPADPKLLMEIEENYKLIIETTNIYINEK